MAATPRGLSGYLRPLGQGQVMLHVRCPALRCVAVVIGHRVSAARSGGEISFAAGGARQAWEVRG